MRRGAAARRLIEFCGRRRVNVWRMCDGDGLSRKGRISRETRLVPSTTFHDASPASVGWASLMHAGQQGD